MKKPTIHHGTMPVHQENFVAGRSAGRANAAINAKASLAYIKEHPGCTSKELQNALKGATCVPLLVKHRLIIIRRKMIDRKQVTYYFPSGIQPPNNQ